MGVIAVAGGTGHLGRTIVEVLKGNSKHTVLILARKVPEKSDSGVTTLVVDYSDIDGTAKLLVSNKVHTIISTIQVLDSASSTAQINLIRAAAMCETTERFITSDWSVPSSEISPLYAIREAALTELRKTDLQWTRFINGYFLDYYGLPYVKSYMPPLSFILDMANKTAAIPGTGNEPMTFTYTFDLAKFVAAILDMQEWEEDTYCYSEKTTWNEFLKLAIEARGSNFTVTYDSLEKLQRGEVTELPSHPSLYPVFPKPTLQGLLALLSQYIIKGKYDFAVDKCLNAKCPEIHTVKVKDMVAFWAGK